MKIRGELYALLAALCNSSIGIFSKFGFAHQSSYISIAFFKCLGTFLILFLWTLFASLFAWVLFDEVWLLGATSILLALLLLALPSRNRPQVAVQKG